LPYIEKAGPILDLYAGTWQGEPLDPKDHILSADEKTSIQARRRCHPACPPGQTARPASSMSMSAVVRCNIWPRGTCTEGM
jgi:hypothetical protein